MSGSVNLQEIHDFLVDVAHRAGEMITSATPRAAQSGTKKNSADLVTETDRAVETMVSTTLKEKYPSFAFIGEETYVPGTALSAEPTFIVDPIDGTTNFIHGNPYVSISLGLAIDARPVVGVVYNPFTRTLYSAIRGKGAYLSDPTMSPAAATAGGVGEEGRVRLPLRNPPEPLTKLSNCLVAVEWGSDRSGNDYQVKVETFRRLCAAPEEDAHAPGAMVHGIRSLGSAALNLCGVAAGFLDAYWETGCWAWDVCAGWVVLEEAGGRMVGAHQDDWSPRVEQRRYFGVRAGDGQEGIVREFWGCVAGRVEVGFDGGDARPKEQ